MRACSELRGVAALYMICGLLAEVLQLHGVSIMLTKMLSFRICGEYFVQAT
jgi:hypothetical protein